jgi:uncharacterized protein (TIGR02145 family)
MLNAQPIRNVVAAQEGDAVAIWFEVVTPGIVTLEVALDGVNFEATGMEKEVEQGPGVLYWSPVIGVYTNQLVTRLSWKKSFSRIKIGTQVWMKDNLSVDKFRNGDVIPEVRDQAAWGAADNAGKPAWCYYGNDPGNGAKYGKLYNWYAVSDPRGLCPTGWHVPTNAELTTLSTYLGGNSVAGGKMKTAGFVWWNSPNDGATNSSGFNAYPAGRRVYNGNFNYFGETTSFWSQTNGSGLNFKKLVQLEYNNDNLDFQEDDPNNGYSIRCIKD